MNMPVDERKQKFECALGHHTFVKEHIVHTRGLCSSFHVLYVCTGCKKVATRLLEKPDTYKYDILNTITGKNNNYIRLRRIYPTTDSRYGRAKPFKEWFVDIYRIL